MPGTALVAGGVHGTVPPPQVMSAPRASVAPLLRTCPQPSLAQFRTPILVSANGTNLPASPAWACVRNPRTDGQGDVRACRPPFCTFSPGQQYILSYVNLNPKLPNSLQQRERAWQITTVHPRGWLRSDRQAHWPELVT